MPEYQTESVTPMHLICHLLRVAGFFVRIFANAATASRVIVEAPQVLKCGIRKDWLVREPMPSSLLEQILKAAEEEEAKLDGEASRELTGDDSDEDIVLELKLDDDLYEDI
ncbi:hypothetical protein M422DRAFT_247344 [Sphaerobolus stellatus SS14]|nr:hypothetical protein M422DRAFT_247344 [Sphaerobolus stellatus SS14]